MKHVGEAILLVINQCIDLCSWSFAFRIDLESGFECKMMNFQVPSKLDYSSAISSTIEAALLLGGVELTLSVFFLAPVPVGAEPLLRYT